ncbi:hypothetical protein [Vibrio japonicus]|uniref:Retention module-containing protein n=1 Tax=Vibrio japonicus TaxID=1824638 RepID=A0ABY5LI13_9VIBR|nr:hypothetical protein [Vibrio japonicus]UUM31674.1 hypothetical protein NP165_05945 [Vibrio japonicus]
MSSLATLLALANTTVVIDINGQIRELLPGEVPGPGEVIVVLGHGATAVTDFKAELVGSDGTTTNISLDDEIASVLHKIEQGGDPTKHEELATAAGEEMGEIPAAETSNLQSHGLSETQSLMLLDLIKQHMLSDGSSDNSNDMNDGDIGEPKAFNYDTDQEQSDDYADLFKRLDDFIDNADDIKSAQVTYDLLDLSDILQLEQSASIDVLLAQIEVSAQSSQVDIAANVNGDMQAVISPVIIDSYVELGLDSTIANELDVLAQVLKIDAA